MEQNNKERKLLLMRLLVAEDDPKLLKSLKHILVSAQYLVDGVTNGTDALEYAQTEEYDGLVLDIMMPGMDGLEVLKRLRAQGVSTPALFLTARTEVYQRVEGLDAGADDYLPKPFATQELLARVRAMLRRKENYTPDQVQISGVTLNRSTYEIGFQDKTQSLSGKEFQIMEMLMDHPDSVLSTDQFMAHIWGWNSEADVSVVWVHISNIRKKLGKLHAPLEIRFIRNAGYSLEKRP